MKYVDIINEEGAVNITSDNETIVTNITTLHPELILEDNSMIIFEKVDAYYDFISNADIFTPGDQDINLESLLSDYLVDTDTVSDFSYHGSDVTMICKIEYHEYPIYYLQRTGINPLSL